MASAPRRAKIAFSLDRRLLARVERLRASTGESRSAVISRALARLTAEELAAAKVERYVQAYREFPETQDEVEFARMSARKALVGLPREDEL